MWSLYGPVPSPASPGPCVLGPSFEAIKPGKRHLWQTLCSNRSSVQPRGCTVYVRPCVCVVCSCVLERSGRAACSGGRGWGERELLSRPRSSIIAEVVTSTAASRSVGPRESSLFSRRRSGNWRACVRARVASSPAARPETIYVRVAYGVLEVLVVVVAVHWPFLSHLARPK